jgi:hypothetical protein
MQHTKNLTQTEEATYAGYKKKLCRRDPTSGLATALDEVEGTEK